MSYSRKAVSVILTVILLLNVFSVALAAAGDLDTTFNSTGYRVTFTTAAQEFMAVAQQADGLLVAVGYDTGAGQDFAVVRYTAAGVPDAGFGSGGKVTTSFGAGSDVANAVAIQSDGKIVVAGTATYGANTVFAVARYLSPTGTLDPAFGTSGVVTTSITGLDAAHAVAIQGDGKIVVAGEANAQFAVARYTTGGVLDTSFSGDGLVTTTIVGANNIAHAVLIQPADQKIIAVGQADQGSSDEFALARYTTTGALDTTFNGTGTVFIDLLGTATNDIGLAAVLQPDGKIVVAGSINTGVLDYAVARFTSTGARDTTFSADGVVTADFAAGADEPHAVAVQITGKIVVAGTTNQGAARKTDLGLVRFTTAGALDTTFGTSGKVATDLPTNADDLGWGMTLQSDNKIVVVGSSDNGGASGVDFAIARYESPNAVPAVTNVPKSGFEDQTVTFAASDFTAHFSDADGDALAKIQITSLPTNGTLRLSGVDVTLNQEISAASLGSLTFVPTANYNGGASFSWNGSDGLDYAVTGANVNLTLTAVNDAPSFTKGANQTVLEDAGAQSVAGWATSISPGPSDEVAQSVTFSVTNNNAALFSVAPAISSIGQLTFTPAPNASGTATVTVTLTDNGGTANGGVNASAQQAFLITVTAVNDAPSFTKGSDQTVFEDPGLTTVAGWATAISAGPSDEAGQTLTFNLSNNNAALFSVPPAVNSAGTLTFTPAPNAFGSATITVTLQDNGGTANGGNNTSAAQTFVVNVTGVNDAPSFTVGADVTVNEDAGAHSSANWATNISAGPFESTQVVTFSVINNNNSLFAVQPAVSPTGTLTFQPAANAFGVASVIVFLRDSGGTANGGVDSSVPSSFVITVTSVNDAPSFVKGADIAVLEDSGASTTAGWATAISPGPTNEATQTLAFTATPGDPALFSVAPAINAATGQLTFTPAANAFGSTTVTVTLKDNGGTANGGVDTSAPQTFHITIDPVNDVPSFVKGSDQIVLEDAGAQSIVGWATAVSAGPANEASQVLTFTLTTDNAGLFASAPAVSPNGTLSFTSAPNVYGSATVTLTLQDSGGTANGGVDTTTPQSFHITIVSVNDAPSFAAGANHAVDEDAAAQLVAGWATAISSGPNEPGQVLTFTAAAGNPLLFSVQPAIASNGDLTYTPAANAYGSTTVTVTLKDDGGTANGGVDTSAPQTFVITLNPVNDAPSFVAGGDQVVNEDAGAQTVAAWATAILAGPANESSQVLTFTLTTNNAALFGALPAVNATSGNLTFTPAANEFGTAVVTVTLRDSGGTDRGGVDVSGSQVFTITVNSVNDAPSFGKGPNLNIITSTLQTFSGWATTIKPGPTNENWQTVNFSVTTNNSALFEIAPAISPLGTLTFKPTPNFNGSALVTVVLRDDGGTANGGVDASVPQTFTIDVTASPDAPINIVPGAQETNLNTPLFFSTATGNNLGVYDEDAIQFNEQMSITLSVGDGTLTLASTAGLTLTTGSSGVLVQFTGSITDVNASLDDLRFDPPTGFFGLTTLLMTTQDLGHPGEVETFSDSDPVSIRVNAPPVAVDDTYNGPQGSALIVPVATGVLVNDTARNARPITATLLSGPASGQLVLAADGSFVYIPVTTFSGIVTFTYQANDRGLVSNAAMVTISVAFINQAPTFNLGFNPAVNEDAGAQTVLNFLTNVTPGPSNETGQTLTMSVTAATPALFAAQPALDMGSGALTYTPAANAFGSTVVTVTLQDNGGTANGGVDTTVKTFVITLNPVNDAPSFVAGADQAVRIDSGPQLISGWASAIAAGPANEAAQVLTFTVTTSNDALFAILPSIDPGSGDLSFAPAPSLYGSATITVTLRDDGGTANGGVAVSAPQPFVITVQPYRLFLPVVSRN